MKRLLILLAIIACKPMHSGNNSEALDVFDNRPSPTNMQPASHFVLRSSLKRMLQGMRLVNSQVQSGTHIYTVTDINVGDIEPSANGIKASATIDIDVRARKGQYIALGASAGANVSFRGQAKADFRFIKRGPQVDIEFLGLSWPGPLVHRVSVWTNARLLRGVIRRKATEAAMATIPGAKRDIAQTITREIQSGLQAQKPEFQKHFYEIAKMMDDVPGVTPHLYSAKSQAFFQHLMPATTGARLGSPPPSPATIDTGFSFNQHIFEHLLNKQLRGRTVDVQNLRLEICKSFSNFYYQICETEPIESPMTAEILFADTRPTEFKFVDNRIEIVFVAGLKVSVGELRDRANGEQQFAGTDWSLPEDGSVNAAHVTPQVRIRMVYARGVRQFKRESVTVEAQEAAAGDGLLTRSSLYRQALEWMLKTQFEKALPAWFPVPAAPSYVLGDPRIREVGGSFVVMDQNHFSAQNGWLSAYFTYCTKQNTQTSLGISMRETADTGGNPLLKVTQIHAGTPASRASVADFGPGYSEDGVELADYQPAPGLQVGDVIYEVDGSTDVVTNPAVFGSYLASRSLIPDRSTVTLKVGRKQMLVDPDNADRQVAVWINIDLQAKLQKVCKSVTDGLN